MDGGKAGARAPVRSRWFVSLAAVAGALVGGALAWSGSNSRPVSSDQAPTRVVSTAPAVTEILFAVGAAGQVVGIDDFSNYPPEARQLPSIGAYYPLNVESILALKPDLVVAMGEQAEWTAQLEPLGVKVLLIDLRTIEDVQAAIVVVGEATGHREEALELAGSIRERIAAVERKVATIPRDERVRVFYEVYSDPLMTAGPDCLIGQMVAAAGGLSVSADATQDYPTISAEEVIDRDPQVIVFPDVHGTVAADVASVGSRPGWASIAAVRDGRIYAVDPDLFSRAGPRVAEAVETLARLLYPEVFR